MLSKPRADISVTDHPSHSICPLAHGHEDASSPPLASPPLQPLPCASPALLWCPRRCTGERNKLEAQSLPQKDIPQLCLGQGPPFHPYPGSLHPLACCWEPSMLWQCRSQPSKWANLKPKAKPSSGPDHPAQRQAPVSRNSPRPRDEMEARGREVCKPASANPARRNSSNLY